MEKQAFLREYLKDRRGTDCMKWDGLVDKFGESDLIGMWIADMEFQTSKYIRQALVERAEHGIFGYTKIPDAYYEALSDWMESRYDLPIEKNWVRMATGCVTGLAYAINCYTEPGDACMILKPVYYPFFNVVTNNHRTLVDVDLDYEDGIWSLNYERIEKAMVDNNVKLLLLCSPHNPCGRVWSEEELAKLFAICRKHNCLVASDEIHQDLVITKGLRFVPASRVENGAYNDILITINSASKTFNLATLLHAHMIIPDKDLRDRYDAYASGINRTEVSVMGMYATMAGYRMGSEWLDNVIEIIRDNYEYCKRELETNLPGVRVCSLDATYLVLIDLRAICVQNQCQDFVQGKARLGVDYGEWFGEAYKGFIRVNLATDPALVQRAVQNLIQAAR